MNVTSLQVEINRAQHSIDCIVDFMKDNLRSMILNSKEAQARIARAHERLMRARQDIAALRHMIDPENYPHPGDPGATLHYGFPRELKKEAP